MTPDANSYTEMLRKFFSDLGLPKLDVDKLIEAQKKNIDALSQSAQVAAQGAQSVAQKQREVLEADSGGNSLGPWIPAARQASGQPHLRTKSVKKVFRNSRRGSARRRDDRQAIEQQGGEDHPGSPERKSFEKMRAGFSRNKSA